MLVEVHAVNARDHRRHRDDRGPRGQPLRILVLRDRDQRKVRFERRRQELSKRVDHLVDAQDVVVNVAEIQARVIRDDREVETHQPVTDVDQRRHRALQCEQVALQAIDVRGRVACEALPEDLLLQLVEPLFEPFDDREVLIDDEVHQRVQHEARAFAEEVRGGFAAGAERHVGLGRSVPDRDQIAGSDKQVGFAELQLPVGAELRGSQDDEQRPLVLLELGALMRAERVFDREIVQAELLPGPGEESPRPARRDRSRRTDRMPAAFR